MSHIDEALLNVGVGNGARVAICRLSVFRLDRVRIVVVLIDIAKARQMICAGFDEPPPRVICEGAFKSGENVFAAVLILVVATLQQARISVSYTHLTLPTILLV